MGTVYQVISHPARCRAHEERRQMKGIEEQDRLCSVLQSVLGANPECCVHITVFIPLAARHVLLDYQDGRPRGSDTWLGNHLT